ncbi:unnamed protein product, partial [Rangifer tarandus platyrhynchus]
MMPVWWRGGSVEQDSLRSSSPLLLSCSQLWSCLQVSPAYRSPKRADVLQSRSSAST